MNFSADSRPRLRPSLRNRVAGNHKRTAGIRRDADPQKGNYCRPHNRIGSPPAQQKPVLTGIQSVMNQKQNKKQNPENLVRPVSEQMITAQTVQNDDHRQIDCHFRNQNHLCALRGFPSSIRQNPNPTAILLSAGGCFLRDGNRQCKARP